MRYAKFLLIGAVVLMQGCYKKADDSDSNTTTPSTDTGDWYKPAIESKWNWQLNGESRNIDGVQVYVVDLFGENIKDNISALTSDGDKVMCMFHSAQVDENDPDQDLFSETMKREYVDDAKTSRWLNITALSVVDVIKGRIDRAKGLGCNGVIPRDTDMYNISNTGVNVDSVQQKAYNKKLANYAHDINMSIGLENDKSQVYSLMQYYDFALTHDCYNNGDCDYFEYFIDNDKPVFDAEFNITYHNNSTERTKMCNDANSKKFSTIVISSDLNGTYRDSCN